MKKGTPPLSEGVPYEIPLVLKLYVTPGTLGRPLGANFQSGQIKAGETSFSRGGLAARSPAVSSPMPAAAGGRRLFDEECAVDIWRAARRGDLPLLRSLLDPSACVAVDAVNDYGVTPLMCAALHGHEAACALLLDAGARLEMQDDESGYTPLHRAFLRCHLNVGALLVRSGATGKNPHTGPFCLPFCLPPIVRPTFCPSM